ncbi:GNAT family N-acetyltransferase [Desulfosporosinus fructosivorans]|uniref:GNAT family N-acetyltransferase n=1 Tax=Desulfosporosinus fructosivorans TaxID=2018669 RepID=A0A4Z0R385_9FIRM|nr:GNAT family N-acetyltransferase [Desulfosporosinus fructosivorans]TGE37248.1 GNAT family N-acetyltransferase [Desulfosporosinus fructosivorans]
MLETESGTNCIIRKATKDDVPVLVRMRLMLQLHMETANERILKHNETWKVGLPQFYSDLIGNSNSLGLLVFDNEKGQAVGMTIGQLIEDREMEVQRYVKINDVWVDEDYRRKGVCSLMVNKLIELYKERGINTFTLNYVIDNLEAEATWRALEFEPIIKSCVATIS